jgi:hypothetical protein
MTIPAAQLGWMAGVIDLRGKIVYKNNKSRTTTNATRQVVMYVESKQRSVIEELCRLTGTMVETQDRISGANSWFRSGCSEHCPDAHIHVQVESFPAISRWTITGAAMAVLIWNIQPFLRNKQEELTKVMAEVFLDAKVSGRGSGATLKSLDRLQSLGWDIPAELYERMIQSVTQEAS